jgi:Ca2+-binding EF-hand superfamily protein
MTQETLNDPKAIFTKFDKDGNGYLEGNELKAAFSAYSPNVTQRQLDSIVTFADENGDGKLSCEEFCNFVSEM